jgi:hypothetical protein
VTGSFSPADALTGVTATPTGGGSAFPATLVASSYVLPFLPPGTYTLTYAVAPGYQTPAAQMVTVTAGASTTVPALAVQPAAPPLPEHLTLGNPSGAATDVNQPANYLLSRAQYAVSYNRD